MLFLIESKVVEGVRLPAQDFGYATIEAIEYRKWLNQNNHWFIFAKDDYLECYEKYVPDYRYETIPVGSVKFCLDYYRMLGIDNIKPLNIPEELFEFVRRGCFVEDDVNDFIGDDFFKGTYFIKSATKIKAEVNGAYFIPDKTLEFPEDRYFISKWNHDIISEWRCFVYDGEILGIKNYLGNEWVMPDKGYVQRIVDTYEKRAYTLDIMVDWNGASDIVELHDFFACGLYGFNHPKLLDMMIAGHKEVLGGHGKSE